MLATLDPNERKRLEGLYEDLRIRLLDLSRKNQLLNYNLRPGSRRFIQIVGCSLENSHRRLAIDEATLKISPLAQPDTVPADERTEEFRAALDRAKSINVEYLTALKVLESNGRDDDAALEKLERELGDCVREELELPPRPTRKDLNRVEHARSLGIDPSLDLDPKAVQNGKGLQTLKFPNELEAIMEKILGDAQLAEQEMGLSTLFLAFGFLEWYESDSSDKKSFAPLLLLPVKMERQKVQGKSVYSIVVREGNAEANLSLQKLLEQRFGRQLPDFGSEEEEQDSSSVEGYIDQVTQAIQGLKRWQVKRWLVLGHFSFGRFAMYQDLDPENWKNHVAHPLVGSILKGTEQGDDVDSLPGIPEDYETDNPEVEKIAPYLIQDADASQHSALVDVMKGKNLVVQGPPGTGKSQTISNVIANALAAGKRVLFLAEKQAALEVVKRRLDRANLGEFCLELHSAKSSPKSVISSMQARYEAGIGRLAAPAQTVDVAWAKSKQEIASYVQALHAEQEDGSTPFALIWGALRKRTNLADLADALEDVQIEEDLIADRIRLAEVAADLGIYAGGAASFAATFGHPARSPWAKVTFSDFPRYDVPQFIKALEALRTSALATREAITRYTGIGVRNVSSFAATADLTEKLPELPDFDLAAIANLDIDDFMQALRVQADLLKTEEELNALSDLRHEDPEKLAVAAAHMRSVVSAEFLERTPAEAYEFADAEFKVLEALAEAVEAVVPVLNILGLGVDLPATHLPAATSASYVLGMSPARVRRWIVELPDASEEAISGAIRRRAELLEAEKAWAAKVPAYTPEVRPEPSELHAAAETLRKSGFGKLVASLGGKMKAARAVAANLGTDPEPDTLEALAKHVAAVRTLFGPAWAGLGTPMEDVKEGLQLRDLILRKVQQHPGADLVIRRAMAMTPDGMAELSPHHDACKRMFSLPTDDRARLKAQSAEGFAAALRRRVAELEAFLAVDPNRWLETSRRAHSPDGSRSCRRRPGEADP